jgi:hypothetical protein
MALPQSSSKIRASACVLSIQEWLYENTIQKRKHEDHNEQHRQEKPLPSCGSRRITLKAVLTEGEIKALDAERAAKQVAAQAEATP